MQEVVYQEGQSFKEFVHANLQRFEELFKEDAHKTFEYIVSLEEDEDPWSVFQTIHTLLELMTDDRQHELALFAKERGKSGAANDHPLMFILELIHSFRNVYWDLLYHYYQNLHVEQEELFKVERKTNHALDTFIKHYVSSYTEHKDELLRSQREMIDELAVPVIPLSSNVAVLPIIGTVDTYRAKKFRKKLLHRSRS